MITCSANLPQQQLRIRLMRSSGTRLQALFFFCITIYLNCTNVMSCPETRGGSTRTNRSVVSSLSGLHDQRATIQVGRKHLHPAPTLSSAHLESKAILLSLLQKRLCGSHCGERVWRASGKDDKRFPGLGLRLAHVGIVVRLQKRTIAVGVAARAKSSKSLTRHSPTVSRTQSFLATKSRAQAAPVANGCN